VILVHRLRGEPMLLNSDLVESIETTPDTVITLVDGKRIVVADDAAEVVDRIRDFRAAVLAAAEAARMAIADGAATVLPFPPRGGP